MLISVFGILYPFLSICVGKIILFFLFNEMLLFLPGVESREFFCRNATPVQKNDDVIPK